MRKLKIGLLGCGVVGGGFVRLLDEHREVIRSRAEIDLDVTRVLVRDLAKERPFVDRAKLTTRGEDVVRNGVDVVVELIGGDEPARSLVRDAIWCGKHVVTANKLLLAACGDDLSELAATHRVQLRFEASVCGAIPIIRVIRESLSGDRITSIEGVVNGTSNFILSQMEEAGTGFAEALAEAQARGFAEADPSLDVDGGDAAQKITILARLAFPGAPIRWKRRFGIRQITCEAVALARSNGEVIRHVASAEREGDGVVIDVAPQSLSLDHPLARVRREGNGVVVRAEGAGELAFYGAGAGSLPSATSVLADVVEIARGM